MGLSQSATPKEIEYAYHKIVDAQQAWIQYYKEQQAKLDEINKNYDKSLECNAKYAPQRLDTTDSVITLPISLNKQFGNHNLVIRGVSKERYVRAYSGYSTHRDLYGNRYVKDTKTIIYSRTVCRQAFEALSGKKLERIKLPEPQEINTDNLDQQKIYDYASKSDSTFEGLKKIIQEERKSKNLEDIDTIVIGENHQDVSQLSPEDQEKAQAALAERLEREKPQCYAEYGMNAAIGGGIVATIALIIRAACLRD